MTTAEKETGRPASAGENIVKEDIAHIEIEENKKDIYNVIEKPESIRDLSPEELQQLETRMVRKIDMVIMYVLVAKDPSVGSMDTDLPNARPIMGVLYILNCIDTSVR